MLTLRGSLNHRWMDENETNEISYQCRINIEKQSVIGILKTEYERNCIPQGRDEMKNETLVAYRCDGNNILGPLLE